MKKISLTFSIFAIILGIVSAVMGLTDRYAGVTLAAFGGIIAFVGIAIIVFIYMYPAFGDSIGAVIVSLVACGGGGMFAVDMAIRMSGGATSIFGFLGLGLTAFIFILCPCLCMQGGRRSKDSVIGIAAAHESISINEISQKTGLSESVVRSILYDAIGKRQLSGKMEGDTFKRAGPTTGVSPDAKVLVICPYCGAKTEQGLAKCVKCGADI